MKNNPLSRKVVTLLMAAVLIIPGTALAAFSDISGHWAESAIEKWSGEYGIIQGYSDGTFHPDQTITRGAFATILDRFLQYQEKSPDNTFSDTDGTWCEFSILKLHAAGVYLGNQGQALIAADITRQQAVAMIGRAFGITQSSTSLTYADSESVSSYAQGYIAAMAASGYLTDTVSNGYFRPTEAITRAEVVNILNNMISTLYQTSGTYQNNITGTLMINAASGVSLSNMTISGDLIIAPGVTGTVSLNGVTVSGKICNLGSAPVVQTTPEVEPDPPAQETKYITYSGQKFAIVENLEKNALTSDDFYWNDQGRLVCTSDQFTTRFGIDVSAYQNRRASDQTIDWNAVAADGVQFAMVRVGLRGTSASGKIYSDAFYSQNLDGAMAAGIETGAYFFSQATSVTEAVEEADYVLDLLKNHAINGPIAYDWEMKDSTYRVYGTSRETATACALAFCQRIESAGYRAIIYPSKYVGYVKFDLSQLQD
jgi:hypothetical protein